MGPTHSNARRRSRQRIFVAAVFAWLALTALSCSTGQPALQSPPAAGSGDALRVLFLGNSYTYYHNLPRLVEEFAAAANRKIATGMIAPGGASLANHLANQRVLDTIRTGRWNFVVLQEQSQLGAVYLVNGAPRVANPDAFFVATRALDAEIRKAGAKTVLYHTWPRRDAPDSDRAMLDYAYHRIARDLNATVAPAGLAWQQARAELPGASLYDPDGSHPSRTGSYLAAAVIFATLTGASPVGGPARISGSPVHPASGVAPENLTVLVDLPARFAGELQRIAWQTQEKLVAAGGSLDLPAPPPPAPPQMPAGARPKPEDLTGRWLGTLRFYPQPATLELWIAEKKDKPGEWTAAIEVRFPSGNQEKFTHELEQFQITAAGVSFVDPSGPNGGIVRYRAAFTSGKLTGVAEAIVTDAPIYAIGSFELKRIQ